MKRYEKGFSAVGIVLALMVVTVISVVGLTVARHHSKAVDSTASVSTTKTSAASKSFASDPYDGWQTLDHDGTKYTESIGEGNGVHFSLKYPSGWQYYPVGTLVITSGQAAPAGYNQLVPQGKTKDDFNVNFNSEPTTLDAREYWKQWKQPGIADVDNASKILTTFTTANGYSALTAGTNTGSASKPNWQYEAVVSNHKGVVIFFYNTPSMDDEALYKQIFNSVTFR